MTTTLASQRDTASTAAPPTGRPGALATVGVVALLAVLGAVIPILVAAHYGALEIPRSDEWSYLLTLFRWVDTGRLDFNGWVSMTLFGQLVLAAPLVAVAGRDIGAVHVLSATVSFAGLLAVVWLGRQLVRPSRAVLVAVVIAVGPLWGPMAATYMTDNWAFTFQMVALALGVVAFRRRPFSVACFAASMAVGFGAFAIRQYAVFPVLAVALVGVVVAVHTGDRRRLRAVLVVTGVFLTAALVLVAGWAQIPGSKVLTPTFPTPKTLRGWVRVDLGYLRLLGLFLLPVVVLAGPVRIIRRAWRSAPLLSVAALGVGAGMVLQYRLVPNVPFVGNYFAREGVLAQDAVAGTRREVIPGSLFDLLVWISMLSALVLLLAVVPFLVELRGRWRDRRFAPESPEIALLGFGLVGLALAYTAAAATGLPVFDRYALPLLPMVAFLLLRSCAVADAGPGGGSPPRSRPRLASAAVTLAALGLLGAVFLVDSASFDGARWKVAEAVVRQGYSPLQIDGGFEWDSWHREQGPPWRLLGSVYQARHIRALWTRPFCVRVRVPPKKIDFIVIASGESSTFSRKPQRLVARPIDRPADRPCVPGKPGPIPPRGYQDP